MRHFAILGLILFWCLQALGLETNIEYNEDLRKLLSFQCEADETFCMDLCQNQNQCLIYETPTTNSIGASLRLTHFFENIGTLYLNSNETISENEMIDFLLNDGFLTIDKKSFLNLVYRYNDPILEERFLNLCPSEVDNDPIIVFEKTKNRHVNDVKYVICDDVFFKMTYLDTGFYTIQNID
ncbi:MAG: hypothetical protein ACPGJV_06085 [Bacteriovoracaceae bacterium]